VETAGRFERSICDIVFVNGYREEMCLHDMKSRTELPLIVFICFRLHAFVSSFSVTAEPIGSKSDRLQKFI